MTNSTIKELKTEYRKRKTAIQKRLQDFSQIHRESDEKVFEELCFCILTANANALHCGTAISDLKKKGLLLQGGTHKIWPSLRGRVRFHNKKAEFIVRARDLFRSEKKIRIKEKIDLRDIIATRDWLVQHVKGYGYKEASHFLRNIGLGQDIAILDRHILKNLHKYGVIEKIPSSVGSRKIYLSIEDLMRVFSKRVKIPLDEMDLLFWSIQTGFLFK